MCRRCGEPDKRGNNQTRRRRRQAIIDRDGDGTTVQCTWQTHEKCPGELTIDTMEQDRIEPGGPYSLDNLVASCGHCNKARNYRLVEIPEGCVFGPVGAASWDRAGHPGGLTKR
jgi:HNH endonuclease